MIERFIMEVSKVVFNTLSRLKGWPRAAGRGLEAVEHLVSIYGLDKVLMGDIWCKC